MDTEKKKEPHARIAKDVAKRANADVLEQLAETARKRANDAFDRALDALFAD
jgi:hypothetical protein